MAGYCIRGKGTPTPVVDVSFQSDRGYSLDMDIERNGFFMRVDVLGIGIDPYAMNEVVEQIRQAVEAHLPTRIVTANPEMIYASGTDKRLQQVMNTADIVTADGIGVVWAAQRLGAPVPERVTGIDLIQALFPVANKGHWRVFFLGGKPGIADLALKEVARTCPDIVLKAMHGYFSAEEEIDVVKKIQRFHPDVLLVGLGAPRQEYWIAAHSDLATVSIGVGGSFDALAGTVIRAPQRLQDLHLEWLYRLLKEPWRWKRQSVLPRFALKVLWQGLKLKINR